MSLRHLYQDPARRQLLVTGFLTFILIGAAQALYGPAFPAFRERYAVSASEVGLVVSLHFIGSFATIVLSGLLITRFGYRQVLTAGALLMTLGGLGIALSPSWGLTLAAALLLGLGFGIIDVAMNLLYTRAFGAQAAPALNLLAALFGIGAVVGPLLVAAFLPEILIPFLLIAVLGALSVLLCARLDAPPVPEAPAGPLKVSLGRVLGFALLYFFYVSSEVGAASWETTHLAPHYGAAGAAFFTSVYWGAMTVGRFIATPVSAYLEPHRLVLGASALAFLAALLTHFVPAAPYAYALLGLAFAPIFPTSLVWLEQTFPRQAERLGPLVIAAANLGAVVSPALIGVVVEGSSSAAVPSALAVLTFALMVTIGVLWVRTRAA